MKKILAVSLVLNAALAACLCWKEVTAHAAGGGGVPVGNGDVNGDGDYDVSDAVYYLSWRFLGGPAPVPIACPPPVGKGLPDTGQTWCYDQQGREVRCAATLTCPGQDGSYATGCSSEGRFVDNLDGTVTDTCTGLEWQRETADVNGDWQLTDQDSVTWCEALAYCENLVFADHNDWRLPNVRELQSIVDYGRVNPAIDPVFGSVPSGYWSSTSSTGNPGGAWLCNMVDGIIDIDGKEGPFYFFRAVRSGL